MLDASARGEGKRLQRLEGAARGRQIMRVPGGEQHPSVGVDDGNRTIMNAVRRVAAGDHGERHMRRRGRKRDRRNGAGREVRAKRLPFYAERGSGRVATLNLTPS